MPCWAAASTRSVIRPSPSSRLNSEWTWRCVKSFGAIVIGRPMVAVDPVQDGRLPAIVPFDASRSTTDPDLEGLVIDALEALPPEFAERLGSVAIVIEEEPLGRAARLGRGAGAVRAVPRHPADRVRRRPGGVPQQDHDLPRSAPARLPRPGGPRGRRDRHRPPRDRPPLRDQRRPAPRAAGRRTAASARAAPVTTGAIRSTHRAYWAPDGCSPSDATSERSDGGARRQVEDVDEGDPPLGGERGHGPVGLDDRRPALASARRSRRRPASPCSRGSRR